MTTARTWGAHQEEAARALRRLVVEGDARGKLIRPAHRGRLPDGAEWTEADVRQLLGCREAILDALDDQLAQLSMGTPRRRGDLAPGEIRGFRLGGTWSEPDSTRPDIERYPGGVLAAVAAHRVRMDRDALEAPSEVLGAASANPTVELWRQAAVHLTAGSIALGGARDRPWAIHADAAWWVLKESATLAETMVVLETQLLRPGMLGDIDLSTMIDLTAFDAKPSSRHRKTLSREAQRIACASVSSTAQLYATDRSADAAAADRVPPADRERPVAGRWSVVTVEVVEDLSAAQRRLARLLTPQLRDALQAGSAASTAATTAATDEPVMTLELARLLVATQLDITRRLTETAGHRIGGYQIAQAAESHVELLETLQGRLGDLRTREPALTPPVLVYQLREIRRGLDRYGSDLATADLSELNALGAATQHVSRRTALLTRGELTGALGIIGARKAKGRLQSPNTPPRRSAVHQALTALADARWPREMTAATSTAARKGLRETLRETTIRTGRAAPSPFVPPAPGSARPSAGPSAGTAVGNEGVGR